jgi:chemotaxis protein MotB
MIEDSRNRYLKIKRHRVRAEAAESRDRWLISYADLVTLLLALFIVLYAAADHERATRIATAFAAEFTQTGISGASALGAGVLPASNSLIAQAAIEQAFAANKTLQERARVTHIDRGLVVSLTEAGFFAPGDASIQSDALPLLNILADALRESKAYLRVEGHTDSLPISTPRYPSNWELSAGRAATVLNCLTQRGIPASRMSVAGFAGERPIADNSTAEGRALNRRVDLVVLKQDE